MNRINQWLVLAGLVGLVAWDGGFFNWGIPKTKIFNTKMVKSGMIWGPILGNTPILGTSRWSNMLMGFVEGFSLRDLL